MSGLNCRRHRPSAPCLGNTAPPSASSWWENTPHDTTGDSSHRAHHCGTHLIRPTPPHLLQVPGERTHHTIPQVIPHTELTTVEHILFVQHRPTFCKFLVREHTTRYYRWFLTPSSPLWNTSYSSNSAPPSAKFLVREHTTRYYRWFLTPSSPLWNTSYSSDWALHVIIIHIIRQTEHSM